MNIKIISILLLTLTTAQSTELKWPDTIPPTDWEQHSWHIINGIPYKKVEVEPGKWKWVVDIEMLNIYNAEEDKRRKLYWALRSRPLTCEEMKKVMEYGKNLNIEPNVSYREDEKARELNEALLQQYRLREITKQEPCK